MTLANMMTDHNCIKVERSNPNEGIRVRHDRVGDAVSSMLRGYDMRGDIPQTIHDLV